VPRPTHAPRRTAAQRGRAAARRRPAVAREPLWVALLLLLHAALAVWGAARHSVTFDENFHLPSGVLIAARGELRVSAVNPPLVKAAAGWAALAAGARLPSDAALADGEQGVVGESFMRRNADRYHRVFFAGRLVVVLCSLLLALVVWRFARDLHGGAAGLVALGLYALAPEALAHAGFVTLDVPTALGWTAALWTFRRFAVSGRWGWWAAAAAAVAFAFLTRFTAVFLPPVLALLALWTWRRGRARRPLRLALGFALLGVTTLAALHAGYLGRTSFEPIGAWRFESEAFRALQARFPGLRLPLPDTYVAGFDRQAVESQPGRTPSFALGRLWREAPWFYFPLALLVKWPLGFLGALGARAALGARRAARGARPRALRDAWALVPALALLAMAVFVGRLGIGIRYLFPLLPLLAVWAGGLAGRGWRGGAARRWALAAFALVALQGAESAARAPWWLSFYNVAAGGPWRGQWIVNDSNVDWGQGLIALRDEMRRRGIARVHLAYHGTTDPAVYGIDSVPFTGGLPGPESDWLAVSSYYWVGLSQRMMTAAGRTERPIRFDFSPLRHVVPTATPAGCMLLIRLR